MKIQDKVKRFFNPHFGRVEGELYGAKGFAWIVDGGKSVVWDSFYCARKHAEYAKWAQENAPLSSRIGREKAKKKSNRKAIQRQRKRYSMVVRKVFMKG